MKRRVGQTLPMSIILGACFHHEQSIANIIAGFRIATVTRLVSIRLVVVVAKESFSGRMNHILSSGGHGPMPLEAIDESPTRLFRLSFLPSTALGGIRISPLDPAEEE
jgi:hypothetical protein